MSAAPTAIVLNTVPVLLDSAGALWWPHEQLLAVADLHLEKGSGVAERGQLVPPYDTVATLSRLAALVARYRPRRTICIGDSFHDDGAARRLGGDDGSLLASLTASCDWLWVIGNHDPAPPTAWGGTVREEVTIGALAFRHQARHGASGEVSGHFHPRAAVQVRDHRLAAPCFATDGHRLILPAFGAYTGGLDVLNPAFAGLLRWPFTVHMLGRRRLHALSSNQLVPPRANGNRGKGARGRDC